MLSFRLPIPAVILTLLMVFTVGMHAQSPRPEAVGLRPDAPTYAKHGPYWVGTREFVIKTAIEGRVLPATLWYPALNPKGMKEANTFTYNDTAIEFKVLTIIGHALMDAPPDPSGGPYSLVVFSHGDENSRVLHTYFMEHLASYGFMALGIDHPKPDMERPNDIKCAIDFAEKISAAAPAFAWLVDAENVAVAGHSSGGMTALQVGGTRFQGLSADYLDSRVKAIIPMSSGVKPSGLDFTAVKLPTLLLVGSLDSLFATRNMTIYQTLPAALKSMVVLIGGTHAAPFLNPDVVLHPGTLDLARSNDLVDHFITAFLLDVLKGDKEAHKALLPEAVKFEEVQYSTTWH